MIPAGPAFISSEARIIGAQPVVRISFSPRRHADGLGQAASAYQDCAFISPDRIRCDYHGFALGYYRSPQLTADLGRYPSATAVTWDYNTPGYDLSIWVRTARTLEQLAVAAWVEIANGGDFDLLGFYQWQAQWRGYRCWTLPAGGAPDDFTAWATSSPGDPLKSYAAPARYARVNEAYLENLQFWGEYPLADDDLESAGRLTLEAQAKLDQLVVGDHTGLVVNNRRGLFNDQKPTFLFCNEPNWHTQPKKIVVEIGYLTPGRRDPDLLLLYVGKLAKLGPLKRSVDQQGALQPQVAEIYSKSFVSYLLNYYLGQPDIYGNEYPYCGGEFVAEAKKLAGRPLAPPLRTVDFESRGLAELDGQVVDGGSLSLITIDPLWGTKSLRAAVTGANQTAQGVLRLRRAAAEFHLAASFRIAALPPALHYIASVTFLEFFSDAGVLVASVGLGADQQGHLALYINGAFIESSTVIDGYQGLTVELDVWLNSAGYVNGQGNVSKIWWENNEIVKGVGPTAPVREVRFGVHTANIAEAWTVDFDHLRLTTKYHDQAYQLPGFPFAEIKTVYRDDAVPGRLDITGTIPQYELLPQYGAVNFTPSDGQDISGTVKLRVRKNDLAHPVDHIAAILTQAGAGDYINAASFADAQAATPDYRVGVYFKNIRAGAALAEICSRCLLNLFLEADQIKIVPYLGLPPALPDPLTPKINQLGTDELQVCEPAIEIPETTQKAVVKYADFAHNPALYKQAGRQLDDTAELDLSYGAPVSTDSSKMAAQLAALYLKRLGAQKIYDPLQLTWRGARNELADPLQIFDEFFMTEPLLLELRRKEINLDPPRQVLLVGVRYLGE